MKRLVFVSIAMVVWAYNVSCTGYYPPKGRYIHRLDLGLMMPRTLTSIMARLLNMINRFGRLY